MNISIVRNRYEFQNEVYKHTPDEVYISFGAKKNEENVMDYGPVYPSNFNLQIYPHFIKSKVERNRNLLIILIDQMDIDYLLEMNEISDLLQHDPRITFIYYDNQCTSIQDPLYRTCNSEIVDSIYTFLHTKQIPIHHTTIVNFIKFKVNTPSNQRINQTMTTIIKNHMKEYQSRYYDWGGYANYDLIQRTPFHYIFLQDPSGHEYEDYDEIERIRSPFLQDQKEMDQKEMDQKEMDQKEIELIIEDDEPIVENEMIDELIEELIDDEPIVLIRLGKRKSKSKRKSNRKSKSNRKKTSKKLK